MTSRPRLVRSIPFWVLFVGSLALTGFGAWTVIDRITRFEESVRSGAADQAQQLDISISTYVVGPTATIGGIILGAGVIGLLLTAAVAAISTILPRPAVEVVEAIDWTNDEESADEEDFAAAGPVPVTASEPVVRTNPEAAPVSEDPDVETPSDAPAPARADDDPAGPR
jgi:hypothetical protein